MGMAESKNMVVAVPTVGKKMVELEQFRADFKAVWRWWRHCGYLSEDEMKRGMDRNAKDIKARIGDKDWIANEALLYATEAEAMRRDIARSERIKAEMGECDGA